MAEINLEGEGGVEDPVSPPPPQGFFSRRRITIFAIAIVILLGVGGALLALRYFQGPKTGVRGPADAAAVEKEEKAAKKKKKPKWQVLYDKLTPEQAASVLKELSDEDIRFKQVQTGKNVAISVDEDEAERAENLLAIKRLPAGGSKGYELLDQGQTLGVTEFDKRIRFLRALSGELEIAIMQMEMIETAKVQIVLPEQRLFAVTQPPVTASILIRRKHGTKIDDQIVFSIIQLIANAVENLQPENVSVIDTEGFVLSAGIFERMAAKEAGLLKEEKPAEEIKAEKLGQPVVPDFKKMKKWYEIKHTFEQELEDKAMRQLIGVLPVGSFKLAITADLGPVEDGEVLDVKRLATSIVVDNTNEAIFLDNLLKKQIFNTVASAIGYVKGRDTIQINKADFLTFTPDEQKRLNALKPHKSVWPKRLIKWGPWIAVPGLIITWLLLRIPSRSKRVAKAKKKEREEAAEERGFTDLQTPSIEISTTQVRNLAKQDPGAVAHVMEEWLTEAPTNA